MRRGVLIALAAVAVLLVAGIVPQLTHGTPRLSGSNDVEPLAFVAVAEHGATVCEVETLFEGTASVRVTVGTYGKPGGRLALDVSKGGRTLARGSLPRFREGVVDIPIRPVPETSTAGATFCLRPSGQRLAFGGEGRDNDALVRIGGVRVKARVSLKSLRAGKPSLLGSISEIASRYGRGNARWLGGGAWVAMALLLLGGLGAAAAALVARAGGPSRFPPAARLCALAAALVGTCWALLIPPFHVPDEIAHVSYVQGLVETGHLPKTNAQQASYSQQEMLVLSSLRFYDVIGFPDDKPPWTAPQEATVRKIEDARLSRDSRNADTASNNPPLYYLAEAPVYAATRGGDLLTQLLPMRLLSVLFGVATVSFAFLFLRELLPRSPWLWPAGALLVALQPLFGFITSGVNADALLFACSAGTLWLMAAVLRRGLTRRRAIALGGMLAAGVLTKPLFLGLVPAALLALAVSGWRARSAEGVPLRRWAALAAVALAVFAVPVAAYAGLGATVLDHPYFQPGTSASALSGSAQQAGARAPSRREEVSYIWQLFLPRLPFLSEKFPGPLPLKATWLGGFVGRFGWLDYGFPAWVVDIAGWIGLAVLAAAVAGLVRARRALRARVLELGCYLAAVAGIVLVIGSQQYNTVVTHGVSNFTQPRYLLPLLALYAGLVAVGVRAFGRRAGPVVAVVVVGLAAFHEISAMLLTVARYYA